MTFLEHGEKEALKGAWHGGLLVFATGCAIYNLAALIQRRESHLAVNAAVYGALVVYEGAKVMHHFDGCP